MELFENLPVKNNIVKKKKDIKNFFIILFFILSIIGATGTYYFYNKYDSLQKNPNLVSENELNKVLKSVSKLMVLPTDEVPTMATVLDKSKLVGQSFFAEVENGDKLLAFTSSMQAIIYRPSTNKIIKVGPIYINQENLPENNTEAKVEKIKDLKIAYYNASSTEGLARQAEQKVKNFFPEFVSSVITTSTLTDYKDNYIINLSGQNEAEVSKLASLFSAQIVPLREGEKKPDADILIISVK
ncbi:MAG: hypothetical protein WC070_00055 [Candidatus Magasanikbacteria bacterium]